MNSNILILFFYLYVSLQSCFYPHNFPWKMLHKFIFSMHATLPCNQKTFLLITIAIPNKENLPWSFSSYICYIYISWSLFQPNFSCLKQFWNTLKSLWWWRPVNCMHIIIIIIKFFFKLNFLLWTYAYTPCIYPVYSLQYIVKCETIRPCSICHLIHSYYNNTVLSAHTAAFYTRSICIPISPEQQAVRNTWHHFSYEISSMNFICCYKQCFFMYLNIYCNFICIHLPKSWVKCNCPGRLHVTSY